MAIFVFSVPIAMLSNQPADPAIRAEGGLLGPVMKKRLINL